MTTPERYDSPAKETSIQTLPEPTASPHGPTIPNPLQPCTSTSPVSRYGPSATFPTEWPHPATPLKRSRQDHQQLSPSKRRQIGHESPPERSLFPLTSSPLDTEGAQQKMVDRQLQVEAARYMARKKDRLPNEGDIGPAKSSRSAPWQTVRRRGVEEKLVAQRRHLFSFISEPPTPSLLRLTHQDFIIDWVESVRAVMQTSPPIAPEDVPEPQLVVDRGSGTPSISPLAEGGRGVDAKKPPKRRRAAIYRGPLRRSARIAERRGRGG